MNLVAPERIERVYRVADSLELNRNFVVVPLSAAEPPVVQLLPDGKVLIQAPFGSAFDPWIEGLRDRLIDLDLSRTPRAEQKEVVRLSVPPDVAPSSGARRYLHWKPPSPTAGKT